jgi:hypothetical protein
MELLQKAAKSLKIDNNKLNPTSDQKLKTL